MKYRIFILAITASVLVSCVGKSPVNVVSAGSFDHPLWRGESSGIIVELESGEDVCGLCLETKGAPANADFIFEVKGDVLAENFNQCDDRPAGQYDSISVADRIGPLKTIDIKAGGTAKVWVGLKVPADYAPGQYKGILKIKGKGVRTLKVPFRFEISENILPDPHDWSFHLDLWQNPYSVARYFNVPLWSEEHFAKMRPLMQLLASAGQKVVTATIINRPWNGQTEDAFGSMVTKTRNADGSWSYDYSVFDKWVQFMFDLGIDRQINCYSMIPWAMSFDYVDAATGRNEILSASVTSPEYRDYWGHFIKDFSSHLKEKGWFAKTTIAMDERAEEDMKAALAVIRDAEPEMKISLAGDFHASMVDEIQDFSLAMRQNYPDGMVARRREEGKKSTWYICCSSKYPNTYLASDPMEATWIGWYTASLGLDGLLRWAYNSWTVSPETDARFRTWPAGDCYIVYPEGSSVRFQRLVEGIQDFEKIRILRQRWEEEGRNEKLEELDKALSAFDVDSLGVNGALPAINRGRAVIDGPGQKVGTFIRSRG